MRGLPGALSADLIVLKGLRGAQGASTKIALHIISRCSKLTRTEYTQRHNNVASIVYRVICA